MKNRTVSGRIILAFAMMAHSGAGHATTPPRFLKLITHDIGESQKGWSPSREDATVAASKLAACVERAAKAVGGEAALTKHLAIGLVDLTGERLDSPVAAFRHERRAMYAASIAKLGVLIAAHQLKRDAARVIAELATKGPVDPEAAISETTRRWSLGDSKYRLDSLIAIQKSRDSGDWVAVFTKDFAENLTQMARHSENKASSDVIHGLGFPQIASVLWQQELYQPDRGGGLWVGRGFGKPTQTWKRDPKNNLSHGANVEALVKAYVRMAQGRLIDREASDSMRAFMSDTVWNLKFVLGMRDAGFIVNKDKGPDERRATIWRKSGSMEGFSHDLVLVERKACLDPACSKKVELRYVAAAMADTARTSAMLPKLGAALDQCIMDAHK